MLVLQFSSSAAPVGQKEARKIADPIREEWQPDGTWTALFDPTPSERERLESTIDDFAEDVRVAEIESEDDIEGHRMALYVF